MGIGLLGGAADCDPAGFVHGSTDTVGDSPMPTVATDFDSDGDIIVAAENWNEIPLSV